MKKRLLSMALVLVLLGGLCAPVSAAEAADDRLARVTSRVKTTLGLNTEAYGAFYGELMEDILAPSWYLEWSGEDGYLSISATEEGKILSLRHYESSTVSNSASFAPSFPAGDQASAQAAAQAAAADRTPSDGQAAGPDAGYGGGAGLCRAAAEL